MRAFAPARIVLFAVAVAVTSAAQAQPATPPPLNLTYQTNGSLTLALGDGSAVSGTTAIVPGAYWVTITNDFPAERDTVHKWHLFGPGVDVVTDLNNGDNKVEQYLETLQPGSTYTAQDDYHPVLQLIFRTSSSGSSTAVSSGSPATGSSKGNAGSSVGNAPLVGSAVLPFRGAISAAVSVAGKLELVRAGKPLSGRSIKAGRYAVVVVDHSQTVGVTLRRLHHAPTTLTSGAYTGTKTVRVTLAPGRWWFFFSRGPATEFFVVS